MEQTKEQQILDFGGEYMNPATGTVATGEYWISEWSESDQTWAEWAPLGLVEVKLDAEGNWVEIN